MKIAKKIAVALFDLAIIFPWVWFFASWVNVVLNNRDPGGTIAAWNLFNLF